MDRVSRLVDQAERLARHLYKVMRADDGCNCRAYRLSDMISARMRRLTMIRALMKTSECSRMSNLVLRLKAMFEQLEAKRLEHGDDCSET